MSDIVERLKSPEVFLDQGGMVSLVAYEAADEIIHLRETLKPFSDAADKFDGQPDRQVAVMLKDCRAARAAIAKASAVNPRDEGAPTI